MSSHLCHVKPRWLPCARSVEIQIGTPKFQHQGHGRVARPRAGWGQSVSAASRRSRWCRNDVHIVSTSRTPPLHCAVVGCPVRSRGSVTSRGSDDGFERHGGQNSGAWSTSACGPLPPCLGAELVWSRVVSSTTTAASTSSRASSGRTSRPTPGTGQRTREQAIPLCPSKGRRSWRSPYGAGSRPVH